MLIVGANTASPIRRVINFTVTIANASTSGTVALPAELQSGFTTVHILGVRSLASTQFDRSMPVINIANATTVGATVNTNTAAALTITGQRIDWNPVYVKSVNFFQLSLAGVTSNTATIPAVTTANTVLLLAGTRSNQANQDYGSYATMFTLTNSTTITGEKGVATGNTLTEGYAVEFVSGVLSAVEDINITMNASVGTNNQVVTQGTNAFLFYYGYKVNGSTTSSLELAAMQNTSATANTVVSIRGTALSAFSSQGKGKLVTFKDSFYPRSFGNDSFFSGSMSGGAGSATDTLPFATNLDKTILLYNGITNTPSTALMADGYCTTALTNTTTITGQRSTTNGQITFYTSSFCFL